MHKSLLTLALLAPVAGWAEPITPHFITLGNSNLTYISSTETLFIDGYDCKVNLQKHTAVCTPTEPKGE